MTHVAARARVPNKGLLVFLVVAAVLLLLYTLVALRHPRSSEHIAKTAAAVADRNY